jgi:hypothetical protein
MWPYGDQINIVIAAKAIIPDITLRATFECMRRRQSDQAAAVDLKSLQTSDIAAGNRP